MKPKEIKCLDPVIKYCEVCPFGRVEYGSDVETYADTMGACYETSCMYGLEDTKPTKKELEEFEKWYKKARERR